MKYKYNVSIKATYWTEFEVDADNEEEAGDKALELFNNLDNISGNEMSADFEDIQIQEI